jgi:hypothetical protein
MTATAFSHPEADEREFHSTEVSSLQTSKRKPRSHQLPPSPRPEPLPVSRPGKIRALALFKRIHQTVEGLS